MSFGFLSKKLKPTSINLNIYTVYAYCVHAIFSTKKPLHHTKVSFPTKTVLTEHGTAACTKGNYPPKGSCACPTLGELQQGLAQSLGVVIARGRCVSGHVERASFSSRVRHRNALTEKAQKDAAQELGKATTTTTATRTAKQQWAIFGLPQASVSKRG